MRSWYIGARQEWRLGCDRDRGAGGAGPARWTMSAEPGRGFEAKLDGILARHAELGRTMAEAGGERYALLAKEYAELEPIAGGIREWRAAAQEAAGLKEMIADPGLDREMRALAEDELRQLERRLPELEHAVKVALLPRDEADARGAILEIRAGTGGEEAALFAGDLYRMYQRYAELRDWRFEPLSVSDTGRGGIKEVIVAIKGRGVFRGSSTRPACTACNGCR